MHLTILGTSDIHANLWGFRFQSQKETDNDGMARLYTYIQQVRAEEPNTILLDAGDAVQGTPLDEEQMAEPLHPVIAAMNFLKFDAMTLGNHEFNWGIPPVKRLLAQAEFPILAANVRDADGSFLTGRGWHIIERGGVRIAVIGVVTPDIPIWDGKEEGISAYRYLSAPETVKEIIRQIGADADLFIVSAHMGMYPEFDEEGGADSAQKILDENPEICVLQAAHDHVIVQTKQGMQVVGAARDGGRDIVRFDLALDEHKQVVDSRVEVVDMANVQPSPVLRALPLVVQAHERILRYLSEGVPVQQERGELLGISTARFQPETKPGCLPAAFLRDTPLLHLLHQVQIEASGADVSATPLYTLDADLPAGELFSGDIQKIYPFDNILYRVPVTGAELRAYMEWSAAAYRQWMPGDREYAFDADAQYFLCDMFGGLEYEIDVSQPKGHRVKNIHFHGRKLLDDMRLTLAVNNYRYASILKGKALIAGKKEWTSLCTVRELLVDYIKKHSPLTPVTENNWKLMRMESSG